MRTIPRPRMKRWTRVRAENENLGQPLYYDRTLRLDRPIYRYLSAQRLLGFLETGRFHFSFVGSWVDPFEEWWHRVLFEEGSPLHGAHAFASCWTWRYKDEPFWRLYEDRCEHLDPHGQPFQKGPPPVRIKSTVGRIVRALAGPLSGRDVKVFVAPVGYTATKELERYRRTLKAAPAEVAHEAAHALTFKRLSFRFEREVRVLWVDREPLAPGRQVPVEPAALIDEIMMGPVSERERSRTDALREKLRSYGFRGPIKRSLMYGSPDSD